MLPELATGGGVVGLVVAAAWGVRKFFAGIVTDEWLTRLMPVVVVGLAFGAVYLTAATPLPMKAGMLEALTVAAAAMAAYSGGKAVAGLS